MRAVIYVRISRDRIGAGLGVERQESDCRQLATKAGLEVVDVFVDNDLSAFGGKRRPGYESLLRAVAAGSIDTVLAWHTDRLHRSPTELEDFITACEVHNVDVRTVQAGAIDLSSASGRMGARIYGAVARHEVEHAVERQKAAKLQAAKAGKWSGGQRPFGYEYACSAIRDDEAAVVLEMVRRVIAGESFRMVAMDLNRRGITTQHGATWNALKVRNILTHKRYAGIREYHELEFPAEWPAIIDSKTAEQLEIALSTRRQLHKQRGPARKFLLTGFCYCGRCGKRLNTSPKQQRDGTYRSRYVCIRRDEGSGFEGCGKIQRMIEPVDTLVTEAVLYRLESSKFAHELSTIDIDPDITALAERCRAQERRLAELLEDYSTGTLSRAQYTTARSSAQANLDDLNRQIAVAGARSVTSGLPVGESARNAWEMNDLAWRRNVLGLLIERVTINPSNVSSLKATELYKGQWRFRPEDVEIAWLH